VQRGGFASERDAAAALERELERVRRGRRVSRSLTLVELVEVYPAQHDVEPVTIEKLRWLLARPSRSSATGGRGHPVGGDRRLADRPLSPGYRFDATQERADQRRARTPAPLPAELVKGLDGLLAVRADGRHTDRGSLRPRTSLSDPG
jgi:hypothetical protein